MKPRLVLTGVLVAVVCSVAKAEATTKEIKNGPGNKREAFVTLLYGDGDYVLSVRVLGLSLKLSGTQHEMIVLCTEEVSMESRKILEKDGWTIKKAETIGCPYTNCPEQYSKIFSRYLIWTLTEYRRIVFLDSDTLVYANIDEIFRCGKFCASYRHSDLFNAGVLVVKPDMQEYINITSKIGIYPSYDTADQGFLNYYYQWLKFAPMFNASDPQYQEEPMRLPAVYNADVGQYYVWTSRFFPLEPYKVLHHTLGPVKPWRWWAYPIFDLNWSWVELRNKLRPSYDSPMGLFIAAAVNLILLTIQIVLKYYNIQKPTQCAILNGNGILFSVITSLIFPLSCVLGFLIFPTSMHPRYAIPTFCLWTIFFLRLFFYGVYFIKSSSQPLYEFPMSKSIFLIGVLLFAPLVVPLYIPTFFTRVCVFLALIVLAFVGSHLLVSRNAAEL